MQLIFAASMAAGAVAGLVPEASALCDCMPPTVIRPLAGAAFKYLGTGTGGYEASLISDTLYGFKTNTAPSIFSDFKTYAPQTIFSRVCRVPWSGGAQICGPDSTTNAGTGEHSWDVSVSPSGVNGANNSAWDYYRLHVFSNSNSANYGMIGGGTETACW